MSIQNLIKEMEMSTHKHYGGVRDDNTIYKLTTEAKIRRQVKSLSEANKMFFDEGMISEAEYIRVANDLKKVIGLIYEAKDEGKELKYVDVSKLIYGSYIL